MAYQYAVCDQKTQQIYQIPAYLWQKNCQEQAMLLRYLAIPIQETKERLWLAIDNENNLNACEIFTFLTHKKIEPILISSEELKYLLNELSPEKSRDEKEDIVYQIQDHYHQEDDIQNDDPIIQLLDNLFKYALAQNASDIHIKPRRDKLVIRLRIDGLLYVYKILSYNLMPRIISRIKLLAKLDISETRLPQDGQFIFKSSLSDILDFRVSSLPTHYGEKLVLRLQKNKPTHFNFLDLGLTVNQQTLLLKALNQPQGLILVTGPTGSGKSMTLYNALNYLNTNERHILTAEDPIEIEIEGLIQTQVNRALNLGFSQLLRTFLRQDPDIIMLGEIRDEESAKIALRAAQTGHLVLSTLHTNDALSAVERLNQLGIQDYEIKNTLLLVIAQRLVRKICPKCLGQGCENCYQGYRGRIGVFQCLSKTENYFDKETACLDYADLLESAKQKITDNMTTLSEVERVFGYAENL